MNFFFFAKIYYHINDLLLIFPGYPHVYTQIYMHTEWIATNGAKTLGDRQTIKALILTISPIILSLCKRNTLDILEHFFLIKNVT